jgi:hypothetical protein
MVHFSFGLELSRYDECTAAQGINFEKELRGANGKEDTKKVCRARLAVPLLNNTKTKRRRERRLVDLKAPLQIQGQRQKSVEVERSAKDADGEVGQEWGVVIELNPADDAVVLHVL